MYTVRIPVAMSHFNALQLQPHMVLDQAFQAIMGILRAKGLSFASLLRDWQFGMVIPRVSVEYDAPLSFFDADELEASSVFSRIRNDWKWVMDTKVGASGGPVAASARVIVTPIAIAEQHSLSAKPARFSPELVAKLEAGEVDVDLKSRRPSDLAARLVETAKRLGEHRSTFVVDRTVCEFADQWYFADIPRLIEPVREALALANPGVEPLVSAVSRPVRRIELELSRPYFWRQEGEVRTQAFDSDGRLVIVHHLRTTSPIAEPNGVVVESW